MIASCAKQKRVPKLVPVYWYVYQRGKIKKGKEEGKGGRGQRAEKEEGRERRWQRAEKEEEEKEKGKGKGKKHENREEEEVKRWEVPPL